MKQVVDITGAAEAIQKSLPPTVPLSKSEIQTVIAELLGKKLSAQKNVYYVIKRQDGTFVGGKKARIFSMKGAATQAMLRRQHLYGATVVPVAMGEIKFEIEV